MLPITLYILWPKILAPPRDLMNLLKGPLERGALDDFLLSLLPVPLCSSVLLGSPSLLPSHKTLLQHMVT